MFCYGVAASRASLIINSFESVKILIQRHVSRSQLEEKACGCPGDCLTAYIFQITLGGRGQRILEWGAAIPRGSCPRYGPFALELAVRLCLTGLRRYEGRSAGSELSPSAAFLASTKSAASFPSIPTCPTDHLKVSLNLLFPLVGISCLTILWMAPARC